MLKALYQYMICFWSLQAKMEIRKSLGECIWRVSVPHVAFALGSMGRKNEINRECTVATLEAAAADERR